MIYFKKNKNRVEKYVVTFFEDDLKALRDEIISKCSIISHRNHIAINPPSNNDRILIRNLKSCPAGIKSYNDYRPDEKLYLYSYDEYVIPYLAVLIQRMLDGDVKAVHEIITPKVIPTHQAPFEEMAQRLTEKINQTSNNDTKKKISLLSELEILNEQAALNALQVPVSDYYPKVQSAIKLKLVDSMPTAVISRFMDFSETKVSLFPAL